MADKLNITRLHGGGVMTCYLCSSKCDHCAYYSSPNWPHDFITREMSADILTIIRKLGCYSIHIGGGEPFLNFESLCTFLEEAQKKRVAIEYIETNSSWFTDDKKADAMLKRLWGLGVDTLLLSISPYHNEYIPFEKVRSVAAACERAGIGVFPWQPEFITEISRMGDDKHHSRAEYEKAYGKKYWSEVARRYGVGMNGRALRTYAPDMRSRPLEEILKSSTPCRRITSAHHFHIDLYGNYLSCSGLTVDMHDLGTPLKEEDYPVITRLYSGGVRELYEYAVREAGFVPKDSYVTPCQLCYEIRKYLVNVKKYDKKDLQPASYYAQ